MTRQLRLIAASLLLSALAAGTASAQQDTLQVSSRYTSHVIFSTDVTYADMSNSQVITAKVVEQNKNMIAVRARSVFSEPCSISALESNGRMWTFIVVYKDSPDELIVDTREQRRRQQQQADPAPSSSYQSRQPQAQSAPRESYANDSDGSGQRSSYSARDGRRAQREQEIAAAEEQRQAEEREKAERKAQKKADRQARREQYAQEYGGYDGGGSVFSSGKSSGKASKKASKDSRGSSSKSSRDGTYNGSYDGNYTSTSSSRASNVSTWKQGDAPMLSDVAQMPRKLYHIGTSGYGVDVQVENIYSYSDITYMVISVENGSGISWDVTDATFVIESRRQTKRTVSYDQTVFPKSRYGTLGAGPGGAGRIVYSFDKMTLSEDQVLKVYLYESSGQRNLVMTVSPDDINRAKSLADVRR
jgi:hypothetical protein